MMLATRAPLPPRRLLASLSRAAGGSSILDRRLSGLLQGPTSPGPPLFVANPLLLGPRRPAASAFGARLARGYSGWGRDPWRRGDWGSSLKTGALVALGAGALIASTSCTLGGVGI